MRIIINGQGSKREQRSALRFRFKAKTTIIISETTKNKAKPNRVQTKTHVVHNFSEPGASKAIAENGTTNIAAIVAKIQIGKQTKSANLKKFL